MKTHSRSLVGIIKENNENPKIGCEVGVWEGGNSTSLLKSFSDLHLIMVDRYGLLTKKEKRSDRRLARKTQDEMYEAMLVALKRTEPFCNRRTVLVGNSLDCSFLVKDNLLDFIFIDANHTYESVKIDINTWYSKVKSGGILSGHDYRSSGRKAGVKKAVLEFAKQIDIEKVETAPGLVWWFIKK